MKSGLVKPEDADQIVEYIDIDLPKNYLPKNRLLMLDIIANNNWERPIYFSGGSFDDAEYIWMKEYLQRDGLAYKLVPIKTPYDGGYQMGRIDTELSYEIAKKWDWGNSGSPSIYHDPQTRKQFGVTLRLSLAGLVEGLIAEQKIQKANEIIDMAMENIPFEHYDYYTFVEPFLKGYFQVDRHEKGIDLYQKLRKVYQQELSYYASMDEDEQYANMENIIYALQAYRRNVDIFQEFNEAREGKKEEDIFNAYLSKFDSIQ
ncbi:MAG: hypothetical protein AAFU57_05220 [Bacteroidota bacterium]